MKKLILMIMLCAGSIFGQSDPLLWAWGDLEGNLRDLNNKWFNTSDDKTVFVLGGKTTLTQTGAQVQTILDGDFGSSDLQTDSLIVSGGATFNSPVTVSGLGNQGGQYFGFTMVNTVQATLNTTFLQTYKLTASNDVAFNAAFIEVGAEGTWSTTSGTRDSYIEIHNQLNGSGVMRWRVSSAGLGVMNGSMNYGAEAQANDDYEISLTGVTALHTGMTVTFIANTANTDGATLEITEVGDLDAILKLHDQALATGDIEAGQVVVCVFDGANWQMTSQLAQ